MTAKDEEGNWTLGHVVSSSQASSTTAAAAAAAATASGSTEFTIDDENDEDHECVICLDAFQVGDVVSWSRFSEDCYHVFHADCIGPWLEGKRQDECPSCRNRLLLEDPQDPVKQQPVGQLKTSSSDEEEGGNGSFEEEHEDEDQDSFFVIVHGLVSRAAKRATYSLIGKKGDNSTTIDDGPPSSLPPASPFRRVVSHQPRGSPPTVIVGGMRRSAAAVSPMLSLQGLFGSSSPHYPHMILPTRSFESEDDDEDVVVGLELGLEQHGNNEISQICEKEPSPFPFRRVQSDIVGDMRFRDYPMRRKSGAEVPVTMIDLDAQMDNEVLPPQHEEHENSMTNS